MHLSSTPCAGQRILATLLASTGLFAAIAQAQPCSLGQSPEGLTFDQNGNLWVASYDTNAIYKFWPTTGNTLAAGATGRAAYANDGHLNGPTRLAVQYTPVTQSTEVFVTNSSGNTLTIYSENGAPTQTLSGVARPLGIAVYNGILFVAENQTSAVGGFTYPWLTSIGPAATSDSNGHSFYAPGALALNGANLYLGTNDGVVHSYTESNFLSAIGYPGNYNFETGTYSDSASGGPTGIALDAAGNVWVSYYYSSDVVKYSPSGQQLRRITSAISLPEGVAIEPSTGYVYVANTGTHDISIYNSNGAYLGMLQSQCIN